MPTLAKPRLAVNEVSVRTNGTIKFSWGQVWGLLSAVVLIVATVLGGFYTQSKDIAVLTNAYESHEEWGEEQGDGFKQSIEELRSENKALRSELQGFKVDIEHRLTQLEG